MIVAALLIATAIPLLFLYAIHALDLYATGSLRAIGLCFLWGGIAVLLALGLHALLLDSLRVVRDETLALYVAPVSEEVLKGLILLYLVRRRNFTYFVDGAVYGFAAGAGFAVVENYVHLAQTPAVGLGIATGRVLSTNLMHACAGGLVGIALGVSRFRRFSGRAIYLLCGLGLAIAMHAGFNRLVARADARLLLSYAMVAGLAGVGFIAFTIRRGLAEEKRWIAEKLGAADRVTAAEAAAVHRLEQAEAILKPLADIFGSRKAEQIEAFLVLQAQLGILRKTLDRIQNDERMRAAVEQRLNEKREAMDAARRAVGAYTMASLRLLFPPEGSAMWQRLQGVLQRRALEEVSETGTNLFELAQRRGRGREENGVP